MAVVSRSGRPTRRLLAVVLMLALSTSGIMARLAYLQLIRHQDYAQQAQDEHTDRKALLAHRGNILDRNGNPLATSVDTFDILIDRDVWQEARVASSASGALAPLVGWSPT